MMKTVLELKKEQNEGIFYRYNIDGTLVWFEQYKDNGNIYTVSVRTTDEIKEDFNFYVEDDSPHSYYPKFVEIQTHHERLTVGQVDEYVSGILYAKRVAEAIMSIFESEEHIGLYKLHHNEM